RAPAYLDQFAALPIQLPELQKFGRVWVIQSKMPGAESARVLYDRLTADPSTTVLASLTLVLPERHPAAKLLFAVDTRLAPQFAPALGSPFAVLPRPVVV